DLAWRAGDEAEADFGLLLDNTLNHFGRGDYGKVDGEARIAGAKLADETGQEGMPDAFGRCDADRAGAHAAQHFDFGDRRFHGSGKPTGVAKEDFASRGEAHPAPVAQKKGYAQRILELRDLAGDRGGGNIEPAGGFADGEMGGDRVEIEQGWLVKHPGEQACRQGMFTRPL